MGNQLGQSWTLDKAGVVGGVKAGDQLGVGSQRTASIHLSLVANFPVTFKERGLLSGSTWNVTLHGVTESGLAGKAITFSEPNGTYSYTLTGPHGYQLLSPEATGTVTVNGNPNTVVVSSIVVGFGPYGVAYDASNKYLYVANPYSNNVSVINGVTNKVVSSIKVGTTPYGVAYDASNGYLYVTNYNSNNVSVINGVTNKVMASSIGAGNNPWGIVYDPSNGYLYVANSYSCNVSVINGVTNKVVSSITVGSGPREITYDPSNGYLYVVNDVSCNVTVINGATDTVAVSSITVGSYPVGIAYDASNGYLYVTNYGSDSVTVINGATNTVVVSSITVGAYPWGIAYDSSNGYLYVTNSGSNNVTVINGATNTVVVSSITVGASPYGIAYDASNGYLYVTNYCSDSVTVINGNGLQVTVWALLYHVIFTETGLPAGTTWYVNISNGISSGAITGTSHSFSLINGTYSYSIATVNKSWHSNGSSFTVNGPSAPQSITFSLVKYAVTFTETGLPSGITWYVNIIGHDSGAITGSTYFVMLTNGTYAYTIQANNKIYEPSPSSGSVSVNGGPKSVSVTFSLVKYAVTFTETGLPSGTEWFVNLSNGQSLSSTTSTISFTEINGTYTYKVVTPNKIYEPSPSSGSVSVNGVTKSVSVTFTLVKYTVTFTETGLPAGITWYVNITGHDSGAITGSTYSVMLTNGTYAYTIQTNNMIYEPSSFSGSVPVNSGPKSVSVTFTLVKYTVTFTETGLPAGITWYVNSTGLHGHASAPSNISFSLKNGTYVFTETNLGRYYTTIYSFTVNVSGKKITETVDYSHWAYITGTISPNNATLTINGKAVSISSSGTFNVSVENGTYHAVASLTGYHSYYSNFTLTAGKMKNLSITLKSNSKPSTIPTAEIYAIVGAIIAIVVIVGAIAYVKRK